MKTIIDTSLLISLARINYLEAILHQRGVFLLPNEVYQESVEEGQKKDMADAILIRQFITNSKIAITNVKKRSIKTLLSKINKALLVGDAAVLALALQEKAMEIMTDDEGLSRIALSLGFKVRASPDLVLQAFKGRIIDFQDFERYTKGLILENRLGPVVAELYLMEGKKYVKE